MPRRWWLQGCVVYQGCTTCSVKWENHLHLHPWAAGLLLLACLSFSLQKEPFKRFGSFATIISVMVKASCTLEEDENVLAKHKVLPDLSYYQDSYQEEHTKYSWLEKSFFYNIMALTRWQKQASRLPCMFIYSNNTDNGLYNAKMSTHHRHNGNGHSKYGWVCGAEVMADTWWGRKQKSDYLTPSIGTNSRNTTETTSFTLNI